MKQGMVESVKSGTLMPFCMEKRDIMFIFQIVIVLLATKLAGHLSVRLDQPSVPGKILIGSIIGPPMLGWITDNEITQTFSQIGVILLMFLAGLETDLEDLNAKIGRAHV